MQGQWADWQKLDWYHSFNLWYKFLCLRPRSNPVQSSVPGPTLSLTPRVTMSGRGQFLKKWDGR